MILSEMLTDRGFREVEPCRWEKEQDTIYVFVHPNQKFGTNDAQYYQGEISEKGITRCIIVLENTPSSAALSYISNLKIQGVVMEWFLTKELLYNITKNRLVPKHEILNDQEKKTVMTNFSVNAYQMPKIKETDPVMRYLGASKGQMIKITRTSEVLKGEKSISYRLVV
jgi:DNA-directed RNA polymerase I, II, and III subunit RPABC1